jgi:hypothetical protein
MMMSRRGRVPPVIALMWQALVITHRYLEVAAGALMWFLSGIVVMYVGFPRVTETERVRTLEPIACSMRTHDSVCLGNVGPNSALDHGRAA